MINSDLIPPFLKEYQDKIPFGTLQKLTNGLLFKNPTDFAPDTITDLVRDVLELKNSAVEPVRKLPMWQTVYTDLAKKIALL